MLDSPHEHLVHLIFDFPLHYFFTSRKQNKFFFKQILGVCWQICLKKNLFSPAARSWRRATRLSANAYSLLHTLRDIVTE